MNVENINKLIQTLDKGLKFDSHEIKFCMAVFFYHGGEGSTPCGTFACIAGHASILRDIEDGSKGLFQYRHKHYSFPRAMNWLGLNEDQARALFVEYPKHSTKVDKELAIEVLAHLADTGEVDWDWCQEFLEAKKLAET